MVIIDEQYGYKDVNKTLDFNPLEFKEDLTNPMYSRFFQQKKKGKGLCYELDLTKAQYSFKTSYFVGVDWIVENKLPIYVQPKQNSESLEINFLAMLFEAFEEPENFDHLDYLYEIDFTKPEIAIKQEQDLLSPLLVVQFIQLLKLLVKKGLRKSYYPVVKNFNSKVRGKILVQETVSKNHLKRKVAHTYCRYEEYGINSVENRILKKALLYSLKIIQNRKGLDFSHLKEVYRYVQPAFANINEEVEIDELKCIRHNPLYKEYGSAVKLAQMILKKQGYSIKTINEEIIKTPPFWIDMSKLFELYVFKKLRKIFPGKGEITYHKTFNRQEPDYILRSEDKEFLMVVDAKYKPAYKNNSISKKDLRQISGYARIKGVYEFLKIYDFNKNLDCLVIYSDQSLESMEIKKEHLKSKEEDNYVNFYKVGIKLPSN